MQTSEQILAARNPELIAKFVRFARPLLRIWFRFQLRGFERLPPAPCLIVANHSALGLCEIPCMLVGWNEHFGLERPVYGLAHDYGMRTPGLGWVVRSAGGILASHASALTALRAGKDVLVFPGGDIDGVRPFYEHRKVNFGKRRGYVRLAREAGVPIVPLATIGANYTIPMAPGGALLARLLGAKRWLRAERIPLPMNWMGAAAAAGFTMAGRLPVGVGLGLTALGLLPLPVRITSELLEPVSTALEDGEDHTAHAERIHARVHGELARAVAEMKS
jgi:1-acyl-sn-glycerol-3-phosphate acyltransferase